MMKKRMNTILSAVLLLLLLSFGAYAADVAVVSKDAELAAGNWTRMAQRYPTPYALWDGAKAPSPEVLAGWWNALEDDTLTQLITLSLKNNRDLQAARAKVTELKRAYAKLSHATSETMQHGRLKRRRARENHA